MRIPIIAIIEFLGIAVAFSIISEFMYHSVYNTGKGREYLHPREKKKEDTGPSFLVGCIWDDRQ